MVRNTDDATPDWHLNSPQKAEFWTDERCFITELVNSESAPNVSLALVRVTPGVTTQLHALQGVTEIYIVQQGSGIIEIDGTKSHMSEGDRAIIAAGSSQRITNSGEQDLLFFCVCTPRFVPNCYLNLEDNSDAH